MKHVYIVCHHSMHCVVETILAREPGLRVRVFDPDNKPDHVDVLLVGAELFRQYARRWSRTRFDVVLFASPLAAVRMVDGVYLDSPPPDPAELRYFFEPQSLNIEPILAGRKYRLKINREIRTVDLLSEYIIDAKSSDMVSAYNTYLYAVTTPRTREQVKRAVTGFLFGDIDARKLDAALPDHDSRATLMAFLRDPKLRRAFADIRGAGIGADYKHVARRRGLASHYPLAYFSHVRATE